MKIGLTGPTGSGKSAVSVVAEELGFQVINCDIVARKATEKGSIGLLKLAAVFGEDANCIVIAALQELLHLSVNHAGGFVGAVHV